MYSLKTTQLILKVEQSMLSLLYLRTEQNAFSPYKIHISSVYYHIIMAHLA